MKGLSTNPRVLLCTAYRRFPSDYLDIIGISLYRFPRAGAPRRISPGLRFIKQNVPEVEILEYPLWHEYVTKLKEGWDVVGFSVYQLQIGEILEMIEEARKHGVKEIWVGNYGALDYKLPSMVDRVFIGPAEDEIAQVFGYRVREDEIEHPAIMVHFCSLLGLRNVSFGLRYATWGLLHTQRGCPFKCTFCQTPAFDKKRFIINFESIKRVLAYYHKVGVNDLIITDETFGIYPEPTEKLTRLFAQYKFRWWAQSRAALFLRYLDTWYERGLRVPTIGVESMIQSSLDVVKKEQQVDEIFEFTCRTRYKPGMYRIGFSMIGYENITVEETIQDAILLKQADFDACGPSVITPYPKTPLWDELDSKYGIFDHDYRHYDSRHLVWHHPYISPHQMRYLINYVIGFLNRPLDIYRRGMVRLIIDELRMQGPRYLWHNLVKGPIASIFINDRKQVFFPKLPHRTPLQSQRRRRQVTTRQGKSVHAERS